MGQTSLILQKILDFAGGFPAIEDRQAEMHENDIRAGGACHVDTGLSVYRNDHLETLAFQSARQHIAVHFIVLNQQYFTHHSFP